MLRAVPFIPVFQMFYLRFSFRTTQALLEGDGNPCGVAGGEGPAWAREGMLCGGERGLSSPGSPLQLAPGYPGFASLQEMLLMTLFGHGKTLPILMPVTEVSSNHSDSIINTAPPQCSPLNHILKCHIHIFFEHSQGW